jgi:hypothetical protein
MLKWDVQREKLLSKYNEYLPEKTRYFKVLSLSENISIKKQLRLELSFMRKIALFFGYSKLLFSFHFLWLIATISNGI